MEPNTKERLILVIGSANMDMVVSCEQFPRPGETILGRDFGMYSGGKGANQAVACARLGGHVRLLAKMGQDVLRDKLLANLKKDGVLTDHIITDRHTSTGIALITVDQGGENEIVVASGSNMKLTPDEISKKGHLFENAAVLLLQLEIPIETVIRAVELGRANGSSIILNPAPASTLPGSLLRQIDYLTPNETEAETLTGIRVDDENACERAAHRLLEMGVGAVILTRGEKGALLVSPQQTVSLPAPRVEPVDTTAAGDAFNGALAFALAHDYVLTDAIKLANTVAAFSVTRKGAQTSMPSFDDLSIFPS